MKGWGRIGRRHRTCRVGQQSLGQGRQDVSYILGLNRVDQISQLRLLTGACADASTRMLNVRTSRHKVGYDTGAAPPGRGHQKRAHPNWMQQAVGHPHHAGLPSRVAAQRLFRVSTLNPKINPFNGHGTGSSR